MGVVTQTSVWPVTVVIEEPTKELQKARKASWFFEGKASYTLSTTVHALMFVLKVAHESGA